MAREALDVLKECEAFLEGHFLLSSGRHSGAYCQMAFLQQYPDKAAEVMAPVAEKLKELNIDVVVGPAMGGIVYAYELGRQMGKRAIFTERVDNVMTLKRFRIHPGERCVIAEDVVTTGVSSLETKRVIEETAASAWASHAWWIAPAPRHRPRSPLWQVRSSSTCPTMPPRNAPSARRASSRWCTWAAAK